MPVQVSSFSFSCNEKDYWNITSSSQAFNYPHNLTTWKKWIDGQPIKHPVTYYYFLYWVSSELVAKINIRYENNTTRG